MHFNSVLPVALLMICLLCAGQQVQAQAEVPPDEGEGVWIPDTSDTLPPPAPLAPAVGGVETTPAMPGAPIVTPPAESPVEENKTTFYSLRLRGINKVTARVSTLEAPLGTVMRFGNLEILAKRCWKSSPEDQPENAALLDIWELKPNEQPARIFTGWMFSSSPAISSLEHAVYDISVLECIEVNEIEGEEKSPAAPAAATAVPESPAPATPAQAAPAEAAPAQ